VWDVGGQEKLRPLWKSYTRCTDGIIFVVDSCDTERLEEAKMELTRTARSPDNASVPILILANKQDLPGIINIIKFIVNYKLKIQLKNYLKIERKQNMEQNIQNCKSCVFNYQKTNILHRILFTFLEKFLILSTLYMQNISKS